MAAFLTDRLLNARVGSPAVVLFPVPRAHHHRSPALFETFKTIWSVTCEWLLSLWMFGVVAFLVIGGRRRIPGLTRSTPAGSARVIPGI